MHKSNRIKDFLLNSSELRDELNKTQWPKASRCVDVDMQMCDSNFLSAN